MSCQARRHRYPDQLSYFLYSVIPKWRLTQVVKATWSCWDLAASLTDYLAHLIVACANFVQEEPGTECSDSSVIADLRPPSLQGPGRCSFQS